MSNRTGLTMIVFVAIGCASTAQRAPPAQDAAADESAVRALEDEERRAVLGRDFAALERLWSEALAVNNPLGEISADRGELLQRFRGGAASYRTFERRIELVRLSGDHAFVMGGETVEPAAGPLAGRQIERRFTNVWRREGATWRLAARHASPVAPR